MPLIDTNTLVIFLFRWVHFLAGITWIGMLYFFNLVNVHFAKLLDAETKKKVVPELMPRALFWFRWGAMFTLLSGLLIIYWKLWVASSAGFWGDGGLFTTTWGQWISFGAILGIIMWFNVWFIIWPAQKKIISWVKNGQAPAEMAATVKKAATTSRVNTYLSVPMLFGMGAASHFPVQEHWVMLAVLLIGFLIAHLAIKYSAKVLPKF
ncbi:MAG: urate hydroxylase PuuD [Deltaproteobacteria bacterium]|nr:urate hydroxylase PuuD [Deltaproteobacteria bacterium]